MAHLQIVLEADDGASVEDRPLRGDRCTIGRDRANDIVLPSHHVSSRHAVIERDGLDYFIRDLGSSNGTVLNGRTVESRTILTGGDKITIGRFQILFMSDGDYLTRPGWDKATRFDVSGLESDLDNRPTLPEAPRAGAIRVMSGPSTGREMALTKEVTTVGKAGVLTVNLEARSGAYHLVPVVGAEWVRLNNRPIPGPVVPLRDGDVIDLGDVSLMFYTV